MMLISTRVGTAAAAPPGPEGQRLDSVVASVGNVAITASEVVDEYRFERFLAAQWPPPAATINALNAARQRLTDQMLLAGEEDPSEAEKSAATRAAGETLAALQKEFARPEDFQKALRELGMTNAEVLDHLVQEQFVLRLIDERLRPDASPSDEEIAAYYHATFLPEFQRKNAGQSAPPLASVSTQIREVLVQKHMNELLGRWLDELRPAARVRYHSF